MEGQPLDIHQPEVGRYQVEEGSHLFEVQWHQTGVGIHSLVVDNPLKEEDNPLLETGQHLTKGDMPLVGVGRLLAVGDMPVVGVGRAFAVGYIPLMEEDRHQGEGDSSQYEQKEEYTEEENKEVCG